MGTHERNVQNEHWWCESQMIGYASFGSLDKKYFARYFSIIIDILRLILFPFLSWISFLPFHSRFGVAVMGRLLISGRTVNSSHYCKSNGFSIVFYCNLIKFNSKMIYFMPVNFRWEKNITQKKNFNKIAELFFEEVDFTSNFFGSLFLVWLGCHLGGGALEE